MRKSFFLAVGMLLAAEAYAYAGLFQTGSTFTVNGLNSPGSFSDTATLTYGTTQVLDGGALELTASDVSAGAGKEWLVFTFATTSGGSLSGPSDYWGLEEAGLQAAYPAVDFIGVYLQFNIDGVSTTPTSTIPGSDYSLMSNPVPGAIGTGIGNSGFSQTLTSPLIGLHNFVTPWSYLGSIGIDYADVNGVVQSWEFAPISSAIPEPSTWAMMLAGFAGLGIVGYRASRKSGAVAASGTAQSLSRTFRDGDRCTL